MAKDPITQYGYEKLCADLKDLKEVQRPNIVKEIDTARDYGDLKENAEYHAAKEKQLFIEARINELTLLLANAQIIDPSTLSHDKVSFGSSVKILNLDTEKTFCYTIVGVVESDPSRGLISIASPIAKNLIGKSVGDEVSIVLPSGETDFEILEVFYKPIEFEA
ncbi:transcription elongation factor GreA [Helicobacter anatolicus]|uniref:transcription elongation factor GreA n=1 Tax=Helicobacter anatolicus TaxID=2905874 RepID=UPI001E323F65|nr:transcription elongation factor GreA [Helicobacter anatolicus]MCE3036409.1 transcription elongation factor GreA [Helicobacter anatolicus]MCE3040327.1 transcription elongation factor GreA [Helicobacter anatolicus]